MATCRIDIRRGDNPDVGAGELPQRGAGTAGAGYTRRESQDRTALDGYPALADAVSAAAKDRTRTRAKRKRG